MADWYAQLSWLPSNYVLHVQANEGTTRPSPNNSDVTVTAWIEKTAGSGYYTGNSSASYSASIDGSTVAAGSWSPYDFTAYTAKQLFSTTATVTHNPNGSKSITVAVSVNDPNNMGSASVSQSLTLTTLTVAPGTPTGLSCTYVSDTSVSLGWTNVYASNGAPTQNKVQASVNGGAFADLVTVSATTAATVATAANRKTVFRVLASNGAGASAYSATATLYTTPAAPTGVAAAKDASANIVISWTPQVAFSEHEHVIERSTDGGTTWNSLTVVAGGTSTYTHVSPSPSSTWKYRVRARNTDTGARASAWVESNSVVLLTAPNAPTTPAIGAYADKAKALVFPWTHNAADTTAQTAYEVGYSTNGGTTWSTTGKVASTTQARTFAASSYAAGVALTLRVRTWGQATSGGSDSTGASPWSAQVTVTFKTRPTVTVIAPASGVDYEQAALDVHLGFSQAEGASFVSATIEVYSGATLLESLASTTLASTLMATRVANGGDYTVKVVVVDSNGIISDQASRAFHVDYTQPVAAVVSVTYLEESGIGQVGITIPAPGSGEVAAASVTVTRTIDGQPEVVVSEYPAASVLTILDTTPTTYGDNLYTVTTVSADGATTEVESTMSTDDGEWAYLSKGAGYTQIVKFSGELKPQSTPTVDSALVKASGRKRPIGLYATTGGLTVSGTGEIVIGLGSTAKEVEEFLLIPGRACYRDPTGRRVFGQVSGSISRDSWAIASLAYTVVETS